MLKSKAKKKAGQFDNYKKWSTNEGYTFFAKDKEDAKLFIEKIGLDLGNLQEVETLD